MSRRSKYYISLRVSIKKSISIEADINWCQDQNWTGLNRPLSSFFNPLTLPGYPLFCWFFLIFKNGHKKEGVGWVQLLNFLLLSKPDLIYVTGLIRPHSLFFYSLTPPVEGGGAGSQLIFEGMVFRKNRDRDWDRIDLDCRDHTG